MPRGPWTQYKTISVLPSFPEGLNFLHNFPDLHHSFWKPCTTNYQGRMPWGIYSATVALIYVSLSIHPQKYPPRTKYGGQNQSCLGLCHLGLYSVRYPLSSSRRSCLLLLQQHPHVWHSEECQLGSPSTAGQSRSSRELASPLLPLTLQHLCDAVNSVHAASQPAHPPLLLLHL